jgi:hypothetical protein
MKIAIMQPYFLPYIGYFQLINSVDIFVIYDNIKYTKKGWINRNRYLQNGKDADFSISLKNDSDSLDVKDRVISSEFNKNKLFNQIKEAYRKAPFFDQGMALIRKVVSNEEINLFKYIYFSVKEICNYLNIKTQIVVSSHIAIDHALKGQEKVIAICKYFDADVYINAIGGQELYSVERFKEVEIDLKFIKSEVVEYKQFDNEFIPWLSILDVIMFNDNDNINEMLKRYRLI